MAVDRGSSNSFLPAVTDLLIRGSSQWPWVLLVGIALDAAVLYALGRLPRRLWWTMVVWFNLVLAALVFLGALTILALLLPEHQMATPI